MNRLTLGKLKADRIPERVGLGPCHEDFLPLLNQAQEELLFAGRWFGTYQRMRICTDSNCITWPREVMTPEKLTICNTPVPVRNSWYEFQDFVAPPRTDVPDYCGGDLLERGWFPTFSDIVGTNKVLRFYAANSEDIGKRVLVQGYNGNGNLVRTLDPETGLFVDGEFVTLASPFAVTVSTFQHPLVGIQKPITNDVVRMYEYDPSTLTERLIAVYQPSETVPTYRRQYFTGRLCTSNVNSEPDGCTSYPGCGRPLFTAMVRLGFIPALVDPDYLLIGHSPALIDMMRSIQAKEKSNYAEAEGLRRDAIRKLRAWTDAMSGGREKTVTNVQPHGSAHLDRVFGGFN